ncbi:MAG: hypothetical protein EXR49_00370 [Dehalococcoidia bacterium]|nr:hypothetical protein [Dehalococcoidia bacterium]
MPEETSREGWAAQPGPELPLAQIIEHAFDYRGNVTLALTDGALLECYVSNRNATGPAPFIEYFDVEGNGPTRLPYARIAGIRFSGKDTSAGKSWDAWAKRRDAVLAKTAARGADEGRGETAAQEQE